MADTASKHSPNEGPVNLPELKNLAWKEFGALDAVQGIGIGKHGLRVYLRDEEAARLIPNPYHGVPVEFLVVGEIVAGLA